MAISPVRNKASSADARSVAVSRSVSVSNAASVAPPQGESVRFSPQGDLLSKLNTLQHQDPVKFQEMAQDMAAQLRGAAMTAGEGSTGPLIRLAERVTAMAQSSRATLRPNEPAPVGEKAGSGTPRSYQLYHDPPEPRGPLPGPQHDAVSAALDRVKEALAEGQGPENTAKSG
jgi:hypothetical protein